VTASSDRRQDIENFVAMGGGSFDLLLNMVDRAQPPKTPLMEMASQTLERPTWLPVNYRLEHGPDVLSLRRADGLFVAAFSAQDATGKAVMRVVEEDRRGLPAYFRQKEYAGSARRLVETRAKHSWERFLRTERRMLDARRNGQMAKVLAWRLPDESQEELNKDDLGGPHGLPQGRAGAHGVALGATGKTQQHLAVCFPSSSVSPVTRPESSQTNFR
jgi:hypothetical protein